MAAATSVSLTSCIDEVEMTEGATLDDVNENPNSGAALIMAIPASLNNVWNHDRAFAWGYGAFMRIRDVQCEDLVCDDGGVGYDWFAPWAQNEYMGRDYIYNQFIWNTLYEDVNAANNVIKAIDPETQVEDQLGNLAAAKAFRAMLYLDLARCYEWLPNDKTEGKSPEGADIRRREHHRGRSTQQPARHERRDGSVHPCRPSGRREEHRLPLVSGQDPAPLGLRLRTLRTLLHVA